MSNNKTKEITKIVIVTRSIAYSEVQKFNTGIKDQSNCPYNKKDGLKKFIKAKQEWDEKRVNYNSDSDAYETIFNKEVWGDDVLRIPILAIENLMKKEQELDPKVLPYASFNNGDCEEVILVLCDLIGIKNNDPVIPFELFLKYICEDVGLKKDDGIKAALFVHDKQILRFGDCDCLDIKDFVTDNTLIGVFDRFCCFEHSNKLTSIFQNSILKLDFFQKKENNDHGDDEVESIDWFNVI